MLVNTQRIIHGINSVGGVNYSRNISDLHLQFVALQLQSFGNDLFYAVAAGALWT